MTAKADTHPKFIEFDPQAILNWLLDPSKWLTVAYGWEKLRAPLRRFREWRNRARPYRIWFVDRRGGQWVTIQPNSCLYEFGKGKKQLTLTCHVPTALISRNES